METRLVIAKELLILVEGKDDRLVLEELCKMEGCLGTVQICDYGGKDNLRSCLGDLVRDPEFETVRRIGLTRDADKSSKNANQSLQDAWGLASRILDGVGVSPPEALFFVLPGNQQTGSIEDLCLQAPNFPGVLACAHEMYRCVDTAHLPFKLDPGKAITGAYLSMMKNSGLQLGSGAGAGCWDLDSPAFAPIRQFVKAVAFGQPNP